MSESSTLLYKLIILYMLEKVDFPLTNGQISEFILDKGYTTYFKLQQTLSEMVDARFVHEEVTHNRTIYHLTEEGRETIQFFNNKLSSAIKEDIDAFFSEHKYELKNDVAVKADFFPNAHQEFSVRCQVIENHMNLIDLTLTVPSEHEAEIIANNWRQKSEDIYALLMKNLL